MRYSINRSTFYKWYHRYQEGGFDALANRYRPHRLGKSSVWLKRLLNTRKSHRVSQPGSLRIPVDIIYLNQLCTGY